MFLMTGVVSGMAWFFWGGRAEEIVQPTVVSWDVENSSNRNLEIIENVRGLVATASGEWAVYVYRIDGGEGYGVDWAKIMPGASIMKLPALAAVKREIDGGQLTLDDVWTIEKADHADGSGPLQFKAPGTKVTVKQVLTELGKKSDNTAWVMINRRLGYPKIEKVVEDWGLINSNYRELTTTAEDVTVMWREIYKDSSNWEYLEDSIYEDRISLGVPVDRVRLVHKVGTDTDVWADSGIVMERVSSEIQASDSGAVKLFEPFILVILNKGVEREEARRVVLEITKTVWKSEAGQGR